jgi:hypothetical protein
MSGKGFISKEKVVKELVDQTGYTESILLKMNDNKLYYMLYRLYESYASADPTIKRLAERYVHKKYENFKRSNR